MRQRKLRKSGQHGIVIIEALVGLAIFGIGVVGLLSSVAVSSTLSADSQYRIEAALIADELLGHMSAANAGTLSTTYASSSSAFTDWKNNRIARLPNGDAQISFSPGMLPNSTYITLAITWKSPEKVASDSGGRYITSTYYHRY